MIISAALWLALESAPKVKPPKRARDHAALVNDGKVDSATVNDNHYFGPGEPPPLFYIGPNVRVKSFKLQHAYVYTGSAPAPKP